VKIGGERFDEREFQRRQSAEADGHRAGCDLRFCSATHALENAPTWRTAQGWSRGRGGSYRRDYASRTAARRNLTDYAAVELRLRREQYAAIKQARENEISGKGADGSGGRGKKKNPYLKADKGLEPIDVNKVVAAAVMVGRFQSNARVRLKILRAPIAPMRIGRFQVGARYRESAEASPSAI
jgi:hypothetical protein